VGDINLYIQAIVAIMVITDPLTRGVYFRQLTVGEPERRPQYIRTITIVVGVTLAGSALIGKQLLDLMGIDLGAFGVAGGLIVALMGFQMLFMGEPSGPQGGKEATEVDEKAQESFEESVIVPYSIPFVAGPGAITTVITIASSTSDWSGTIAALIGVLVVVILTPIGYTFIASRFNPSPQAEKLMTKIGGLLVATIGIQLMLGGIQRFFLGG